MRSCNINSTKDQCSTYVTLIAGQIAKLTKIFKTRIWHDPNQYNYENLIHLPEKVRLQKGKGSNNP